MISCSTTSNVFGVVGGSSFVPRSVPFPFGSSCADTFEMLSSGNVASDGTYTCPGRRTPSTSLSNVSRSATRVCSTETGASSSTSTRARRRTLESPPSMRLGRRRTCRPRLTKARPRSLQTARAPWCPFKRRRESKGGLPTGRETSGPLAATVPTRSAVGCGPLMASACSFRGPTRSSS